MSLLIELIRNELKYSKKHWVFDCMQFSADVFATSLSAAPFIFLGALPGLENIKLLALVVLSIKIFMRPFISSLFHFLWAFREGHLLVFMTRPFSNILFYFTRWLTFRLVFLSTITSLGMALLTVFIVPIPLHRVLIAILSVSLWAFFFSSILVYLSCLFEKDMPLDYLFSLLWRFTLIPFNQHPKFLQSLFLFIPHCVGVWFVLKFDLLTSFILLGAGILLSVILMKLSFNVALRRAGEYAN